MTSQLILQVFHLQTIAMIMKTIMKKNYLEEMIKMKTATMKALYFNDYILMTCNLYVKNFFTKKRINIFL